MHIHTAIQSRSFFLLFSLCWFSRYIHTRTLHAHTYTLTRTHTLQIHTYIQHLTPIYLLNCVYVYESVYVCVCCIIQNHTLLAKFLSSHLHGTIGWRQYMVHTYTYILHYIHTHIDRYIHTYLLHVHTYYIHTNYLHMYILSPNLGQPLRLFYPSGICIHMHTYTCTNIPIHTQCYRKY